MHIELDGLDTRSVLVALPRGGPDGSQPQAVRVREIIGLRGKLGREPEGVRLSDVNAEAAILDALQLVFGTVRLASEGTAKLRGVTTRVDPSPDHVHFDLDLAALASEHLCIDVGATVEIAAATELSEPRLQVRGTEGRIKAATARLRGLSVRLGALAIEVPELRARDLLVAWGHGSFHLRAAAVEADALAVTSAGARLRCHALSAAAFAIADGDVTAEDLRVARSTLELEPGAARAQGAVRAKTDDVAQPRTRARPLFDFRLLDGLAGRIHADVTVATTLPVVQRRRATHRFRIAIDQGSLDYRALESDLSRLEDELIDFSLRDDALVLELGVPLLPTRGRGKPLLRWPLSAPEIELARGHRVRLSTLLRPFGERRASKDAASDSSGSAVELIELELQLLDVALSLSAPVATTAAIVQSASLGSSRVTGRVHHHRAQPPPKGEIEAELDRLALELDGLPLGDRRLTLSGLGLGKLAACRLILDGVRPRRVTAELHELALGRVAFAE